MKNPWIPLRTTNSTPSFKVFCFHYAGGAANIFNMWQKALEDVAEVCAIQMPGRWERFKEPLHMEMGSLIRDLEQGLASELSCPYIVVGYSLGALTAFEWLRSLQKKNASPAVHFLVISKSAPSIFNANPPIYLEDSSRFLEKMQENYGGVPEAILKDPELREIFLPILKADMTVLETYKYEDGPKLKVPITAVRGISDRGITKESLSAWSQMTSETFQTLELPCGHFISPSHLDILLKLIRSEIASFINDPKGFSS